MLSLALLVDTLSQLSRLSIMPSPMLLIDALLPLTQPCSLLSVNLQMNVHQRTCPALRYGLLLLQLHSSSPSSLPQLLLRLHATACSVYASALHLLPLQLRAACFTGTISAASAAVHRLLHQHRTSCPCLCLVCHTLKAAAAHLSVHAAHRHSGLAAFELTSVVRCLLLAMHSHAASCVSQSAAVQTRAVGFSGKNAHTVSKAQPERRQHTLWLWRVYTCIWQLQGNR